MKLKQIILISFIFAFVLRVVIASYYLNPKIEISGDIKKHRDWAIVTHNFGFDKTLFPQNDSYGIPVNNQPFGTAYFYAGFYHIYGGILNVYSGMTGETFSQKETGTMFMFVIKLISISADMVIGLFLYYIIRNETRNKKAAFIASCVFLFSPITLYNSAVWGQTDAINNSLFVGSLYLLYKNKPRYSVFLFLLSLLFKLSLLPVLPLYVFFHLIIIRKNILGNFIFSALFGIITLFTFTLCISSNPIEWWKTYLIHNSQGELPYISVYSFNFWWLLFQPKFLLDIPSSESVYLGLKLGYWGYLLFIILSVPVFIRIGTQKIKKNHYLKIVTHTVFCIEFLMYLFLPRMHERYLYPAVLMMTLFIALKGITKKDFILLLLITSINFINLYIVWHPIYIFPTLIEGLIAHWKVRLLLSGILVASGMYYYIDLLRNNTYYSKQTKNSITI